MCQTSPTGQSSTTTVNHDTPIGHISNNFVLQRHLNYLNKTRLLYYSWLYGTNCVWFQGVCPLEMESPCIQESCTHLLTQILKPAYKEYNYHRSGNLHGKNNLYFVKNILSPDCQLLLIWYVYFLSLILKPTLFFVLWFAFNIIHRGGRAQKKTGKAWEHLPHERCLVDARWTCGGEESTFK